jgi:hypothetical protein
MTTQEAPAAVGELLTAPGPSRFVQRSALRLLRSTWLPVATLGVVTIAALAFYGVPVVATLTFAGYVVLGIVLPGTLLWRAVQRRSGWFVLDVAAGAVLGYALEVFCYIGARAIGLPLLVLAWPIATILAFALVPGLRPYWRGAGADRDRTPAWWAWSLAGSLGVILLWTCTQFFRNHALAWPAVAGPDPDSLFQLGLVAEAKHHMPLAYPWLPEQPVLYHWFVYADMAATSWVTGIDPQLLLLRLSVLPFVAISAVLFAAIARKLTGRWWAGPAAVITSYFVLAPNPYHWPMAPGFSYYGTSPVEDGSTFRTVMWTSPTATFGAMLFAGIVVVLVELLKRRDVGLRERLGQWVLLTVLMFAVAGGKATFLPIALGGVLLLLGVQLVFRQGINRVAIVATGIVLACLAFSQVVLFGGASQGLVFHPLATTIIEGGPYTAGFLGGFSQRLVGWRGRMLLMAALTMTTWLGIWAGIVFLFIKRKLPSAILLTLLGIGAAGLIGVMSFGDDGGAEGWFFSAARPYLSIAAVVGLASVTKLEKATRRSALAILGALFTGALIVFAVMRKTPQSPPSERSEHGVIGLGWALIWPYAVVYAAIVLIIVGLVRYRHRLGELRPLVPALSICLLAGAGLFSTVRLVNDSVGVAIDKGWSNASDIPVVSYGTIEAGRWLRDHSSPNDLVATNAHCLPDADPPDCDNRHFAISAYSERRVLIEGWGFTARTHVQADATGKNIIFAGYWDPQKLDDNDSAFDFPSQLTVGRLRDQYGVKWMFVDDSVSEPPASLAQFATLRFSFGLCKVYEINR